MSIEEIKQAVAAAETIAPYPDLQAAADDRDIERDRDIEGGPEVEVPPEVFAGALPLNDFGNGQRLLHYYGADVLFVPRLGWYRWSGQRWLADEDELTVRRDAQKVAARILGEIDHLALEPFERAALDLALETRDQLKELEAKDSARIKAKARGKGEDLPEASPEDRERLVELRKIAAQAIDIRGALNRRKAAHRGHAKNSGNTSKISNMLLEARPEKACSINDLNADPLMVNLQNGTLIFREGIDPHDSEWGEKTPCYSVELVPHDRVHKISKMMLANYDPAAKCEAWQKFLDIVQPDKDVQDFLQRFCGYCMTGLTREQKLVFNFGGGRNGKSTFVDTLGYIFADYGTTVPIETLTGTEQRKGSDATPDLVKLPGARFVRSSEPEQGTKMKEALIKALTGGEAIMIRRMMQEFVEVVPEFKLMISGNYKPDIRGSDDGIWRRVLLVPWLVQIAKGDIDRGLGDRLKKESDGIMGWLVEGCLKYLQDGLREPAAVIEATEEYRTDSDDTRTFLLNECNITGVATDTELTRDLSDAFNAWMVERGQATWQPQTIFKNLKARSDGGVTGPDEEEYSAHKSNLAGYKGILLSPDARARMVKYREERRSFAGQGA